MIEEKMLEILKKQKGLFISIRDIVDLSNEDHQDVYNCLRDLEESGQILSRDGSYTFLNEEYAAGTIYTNSRGDKYIYDKNNYRIFVEPYHGLKEYDFVILNVGIGRRSGEVEKIVKRGEECALFEVVNENGVKSFKAIGHDINVNFEGNPQLVDGDLIFLKISTDPKEGLYDAEFHSIVAHRDDPDIDIKKIALSHNIQLNFSNEVMEELKQIPSDIKNENLDDRVDLRDEKIFTIDGEDTKDIDDAISIKELANGNYELGVHIADVSHYVQPGTELFKEAYQRGTSVYLADSVIPMLPHQLSNGICSLMPNEDRLTLSCVMEVDKQANVINHKIFKSVINSKNKMTYEDVNHMLINRELLEGYEDFEEEILLANELSEFISKRSYSNGKLNFDSNEAKIIYDENGNVNEIVKREQKSAELIIENFMVLTNEVIAKAFGQKGVFPFVYRVHNKPSDFLIDKVIEQIEGQGHILKSIHIRNTNKLYQALLSEVKLNKDFPLCSTYILRSMPPAKYSPENDGHFGLASKYYTHFTSPIRRLSDLIVHILAKKYLSEKVTRKDAKNIETKLYAACEQASRKEREANRAEMDVFKLMCIKYIEHNLNEVYSAIIMDVAEDVIGLRTDNLIRGNIPSHNLPYDRKFNGHALKSKNSSFYVRPGDLVEVKVSDWSKENLEINFQLEKIKEKVKVKKRKHRRQRKKTKR